ncbi:MAG: hypothetical protein Kilf2KO_47430 [Rhodospirillales bacterium]
MLEMVERPSEAMWEARHDWLAAREADYGAGGAGRISEQAAALMVDLQRAFCAGAWAGTVVLAGAIVDAQAFHAGFPPQARPADQAWLRGLRNKLMHEERERPVITLEDQWLKGPEWEKAAKRAAALALEALYVWGRGK